jgi:hypothetical protein
LNDDLLSRAKAEAQRSGRTLTAVVEDALRQSLSAKRDAPMRSRIRLKAAGKGGLCPGVDLDRTAELLDVMDETGG